MNIKKVITIAAAALAMMVLAPKQVHAQDKIEIGSVFYSFTGTMVYNVYNYNCSIMDLYSNKSLSQEEALKQATRQLNTIEYVLNQVEVMLKDDSRDKISGNNMRYFKNVKMALVMLRGQADNLKQFINGDESAKARYDVAKESAWSKVLTVMAKQ